MSYNTCPPACLEYGFCVIAGCTNQSPVAVCPECRQGKCRNCDGYGWWDDATDRPMPCECPGSFHDQPTTTERRSG